MSRFYVAAKFEDYARAREVMAELKSQGHTISYDWTACEDLTPQQAVLDKWGVLSADALVLIVEKKLPYLGSIVEFGMAIAKNLPVFVLGTAIDDCIFLKLPQVQRGMPRRSLHTTSTPS